MLGRRPLPTLVANCFLWIARWTRVGKLGLSSQRFVFVKALLIGVAIAAMVCTGFATLTAVVFCLGMGANASPAEIRSLKFWMLGLSLVGLGGIGAGVYLLRAGQFGWAIGAGFLPTVIVVGILAVALIRK